MLEPLGGFLAFGPQTCALGAAHLIHRLIQMARDMEPIQHVQSLAGLGRDDLQVGLPHVAAHKTQPFYDLRPQCLQAPPMDSTPRSSRCAKPHCTNHSTDRYTASQLVWNVRAVSRQLNRRAQRAKNPIMAHVTGRFPSLHGMCSTTTPCSAHSTRRGA